MSAPARLLGWAVLLVVLCALPALALAQRADPATLDYQLRARELAGGVYVVEGANADFSVANGCNIINTGFIATGAGVIVINTGPSRRYGEQLRALIARTTPEPVIRVVHLNLHPDYFLGNQAFADVPRLATPATRAGMQRDAKGYEDNLYRLCGEWLKGTEALLPDTDAKPGVERVGAHELEWVELHGHTDSDLVLIDRSRGVVFAGGLVFARRVPTTPHAQVDAWRASLRTLAAWPPAQLVPSHGRVADGWAGIVLTQRYLGWLDSAFRDAAARGLEMNEVLRMPVPDEFRGWAGFASEYVRNVANLYPRYEAAVLERAR
ncbi:MAG TPA: quinoprotein relay system zinc metallohydrolase 1 [Burkholderiaceae bacterium]|nr:quinoprotein relay system zinc metallohydrolase 1 [Burkholderiaceae bacterium]